MPRKSTESKRIYFIIPYDLTELTIKKLYDNQMSFVDKIFISKSSDKHFVNMILNITIENKDTFYKLAKKINQILECKYKIFYKDTNNKFTYIDENILNDNKNALNLFINDD